jgi:hypothetical protein
MTSSKRKPSGDGATSSGAKPAVRAPEAHRRGDDGEEAGKSAFDLAKATLGGSLPGVTVAEDGTRAELSHLGVTFAVIERGPRSVVASFLVQESDRTAVSQVVGYSPDPIRAGWWRLRLGKEPRRWQEANVATFAGRTIAALRAVSNVGRWRNLCAAQHPYVVMPRSQVHRWGDDSRGTELALAKAAPRGVAVLDRPWGQALVLGSPDPLYFHPTDEGGLLVRVAALDLRDEQRLRELVAEIGPSIYESRVLEVQIHEPLCAFDASVPGTAVTPANSLACDLRAGLYAVWFGRFAPSSRIGLDVVSLARR